MKINSSSQILLTGATGLIGGEIACELAKLVKSVYCLARAKNGISTENRLLTRWKQTSNTPPQIHPISGDLHQERLGLDQSQFDHLTESIQVIVHCAAETSFLSNQSCEQTNVKGTQNLIEFAKSCRQSPFLIYISTACNVGKTNDTCLTEDEGCRPENVHYNEYTRTKAISEKMIQESGLNSMIIRPSIVLSAGIRNRAFARQILWFVPLMNEFEALPLNPDARLDIIPVSFFSKAFSQLLLLPDKKYNLYHVSAGQQSHSVRDWVEMTSSHYGRKKPLQLIHPEAWTRRDYSQFVKTKLQRKIFFALRFYLPFINMNTVFDNARLEETLGTLKVPSTDSYIQDILSQINLEEALVESEAP
jgi:thioester reductase-like protein